MTFTAEQQAQAYKKEDQSSYANYEEVITTDLQLVWTLNFDKETISGSVEHTLKVLKDGVDHVNFDTSHINIDGEIKVDSQPVKYTVGERHQALGSKLTVQIPEELRKANTVFNVLIHYNIDNTASATQWVQPSATKGGKHPFLFTQSQAIHARSLLPCMDSPAVKTTYHAIVYAPEWCTVLMSALEDTTGVNNVPKKEKLRAFVWKQPVPTSAYLIALAAGQLASREVSDRVRIWAEPDVVESAHNEFAETEEFLAAAEAITACPYVWTRYDVLCLPPSFPYGGMENPCLTFATPTLLAGDRSLADVIAHEIAHSWTGNLVTNAVWDHFWLNEGWTVWLERKITSRVKNNTEVGKLSAQIGYKALVNSVEGLGATNPFTQIVWPLKGEDPDDAFSSVPYEKGFNLLTYLETIVGEELFLSFFQAYIQQYKFTVVTSGEFRDFFVKFVSDNINASISELSTASSSSSATSGKKNKKNKNKSNTTTTTANNEESVAKKSELEAILKQVTEQLDWETLFFSQGLPVNTLDFSNSLSANVKTTAQRWLQWAAEGTASASPCDVDEFQQWTSTQKQLFLDTLLVDETLDVDAISGLLNELERCYSFAASQNAEIMFRFQSLAIKGEVAWIVPAVEKFLISQGRMKFVRPLYRALRLSQVGAKAAAALFEANKQIYHPIAMKMIERDMANASAILPLESLEEEVEEVVAETEVDVEQTPVTTTATKEEEVASVSNATDNDNDEAQSTTATIATTVIEAETVTVQGTILHESQAAVEPPTASAAVQQTTSSPVKSNVVIEEEVIVVEKKSPVKQQTEVKVEDKKDEVKQQVVATSPTTPAAVKQEPTITSTNNNTPSNTYVPTSAKIHNTTPTNSINNNDSSSWSWPVALGFTIAVGVVAVSFATKFLRRK